MTVGIERYVQWIAEAHGVAGHTTLPDGRVVYSAYRDGDYELCTPETQLTDVDGDITAPEWLDGRETILALRDVEGNERHDLVEVVPETGEVTPILDDEYLIASPRQNPSDPGQIAFVSNRDGSLDLYTVAVESGAVSKLSEVDESVGGFSWAPDGTQLVYQAGYFVDESLRLVDLASGTDELLIDEPDSEQSLTYGDDGHWAWSEAGILLTTNHETGFREIAVADADGEYDLLFVNERDTFDARWTADGDVVFVESRGGDHAVRRLSEGEVTTVEPSGFNTGLTPRADGVYYQHFSTETAGDLDRDGETVVPEGQVDIPTVAPEEVTYESFDGQEIAARLYTPAGEPVAGVVKPHGGPAAKHFNRLDLIAQTLVERGFQVLAPDFRGSIGYGRDFRTANDRDFGGGDLTDVVTGAAYLRDIGRSRVGITGVSYGGYLTLMGVGSTDAFDAGASVCGIVNWTTTVENSRGYLADYAHEKMGGTPDERSAFYRERSPISYVDDMDVPLLIVQGANDPRVPQSEADQLVSSLDEREIPHEYVLFEDEGHGIIRTTNRVEYVSRVSSFFEAHLS